MSMLRFDRQHVRAPNHPITQDFDNQESLAKLRQIKFTWVLTPRVSAKERNSQQRRLGMKKNSSAVPVFACMLAFGLLLFSVMNINLGVADAAEGLSSTDDWVFIGDGGGYVDGFPGRIQNTGTGNSYGNHFFHKDGFALSSGQKVSFDFMLSGEGTKAYFAVESRGEDYERFTVIENNGRLLARATNKAQDPIFDQEIILPSGTLEIGTWYSAAITLDEIGRASCRERV